MSASATKPPPNVHDPPGSDSEKGATSHAFPLNCVIAVAEKVAVISTHVELSK
jgi:hypothetical protein